MRVRNLGFRYCFCMDEENLKKMCERLKEKKVRERERERKKENT